MGPSIKCPNCGVVSFGENPDDIGLQIIRNINGIIVAPKGEMFPVTPWYCQTCDYVEFKVAKEIKSFQQKVIDALE